MTWASCSHLLVSDRAVSDRIFHLSYRKFNITSPKLFTVVPASFLQDVTLAANVLDTSPKLFFSICAFVLVHNQFNTVAFPGDF